MTGDRDQLAELIGSVRADEPDPLTYCDCPDPQQLADAILAAGWRKTDEVGHNHWTPDVMPDGKCPACDRIADEVGR